MFFTTAYSTTSAILGYKEFSTQLDGFYSMIGSYMAPGDPSTPSRLSSFKLLLTSIM